MNNTSELTAVHPHIPSTFCATGNKANLIANSEGSQLPNFYDGFPQCYSLTDATGKKVVREDVNAMVHYCTRNQYYNQAGGLYTFDTNVAQAIGGYPLGAILRYIDKSDDTSSGQTNPSAWKIRTVRSMKINNMDNFVTTPSYINGTSWKYVDGISGINPALYSDSKMKKTFSFNVTPLTNQYSNNEFVAPYNCIVFLNGVIQGSCNSSGNAVMQIRPSNSESYVDGFSIYNWTRFRFPSVCGPTRCFYLAKGDSIRIFFTNIVTNIISCWFELVYAPLTSV